MNRPFWLIASIAAAAIAVAVAFVVWIRWTRPPATMDLYARLPYADRMVVAIDFRALRTAHLLAELPGQTEESDYKSFVRETAFDYKKDLDHLIFAASGVETHAWLIGRFDWRRIQLYIQKQGGKCLRGVCSMDSQTPGRMISVTRYRSGTLAFTSAPGSDAMRKMMQKPSVLPPPPPPSKPLWIYLPHGQLTRANTFSGSMRFFAAALSDAERAFLSVGPKDGRFEAVLEAVCPNESVSRQATRELQAATVLVTRLLAREKQTPDPSNLSGVLARGTFVQDGNKLVGTWPIEKAFLDSLTLETAR
ncbi:MAG: hypothetical protein HYZ37_06475 [Candidatus Solibacter usitatus]|nr:hypothetical protein [Candidatus Solibacter usitatus]